MNKYRFAVTGAQGTGKSTLARDLAKACQSEFGAGIVLLEGIGAAVQSKGLPLGLLANVDTLHAFVTYHFRRERCCGDHARIIVQDRCMMDLYAYARLVRPADGLLLEMLAELTVVSLSRVDATFYTPIIAELAASRSPNETVEFRTAVDREIVSAATQLQIPLVRLEGSCEERVTAAIRFVHRRIATY